MKRKKAHEFLRTFGVAKNQPDYVAHAYIEECEQREEGTGYWNQFTPESLEAEFVSYIDNTVLETEQQWFDPLLSAR